MIGEFINIISKSIKLDKTLYTDNKNFGEAAIYFSGKWTLYLVPTLPFGNPFEFKVPSKGT